MKASFIREMIRKLPDAKSTLILVNSPRCHDNCRFFSISKSPLYVSLQLLLDNWSIVVEAPGILACSTMLNDKWMIILVRFFPCICHLFTCFDFSLQITIVCLKVFQLIALIAWSRIVNLGWILCAGSSSRHDVIIELLLCGTVFPRCGRRRCPCLDCVGVGRSHLYNTCAFDSSPLIEWNGRKVTCDAQKDLFTTKSKKFETRAAPSQRSKIYNYTHKSFPQSIAGSINRCFWKFDATKSCWDVVCWNKKIPLLLRFAVAKDLS